MIAVPAAAPRGNQSLAGLEAIVADCGAVACLDAGISPRAKTRLLASESLRAVRWVDEESLSAAADDGLELILPEAGSIAYLQYTSGSTGQPRGVMISHENLVRNQEMMAEAAGHDSSIRCVGWLPLFHDMGLTAVVQTLYHGGRCVLIPPRFFLQKPLRWLSGISRYGATSSAAPNFAYDLCTRSISPDQLAGLDLSSWRVAISGGEPVRAQTLDRFAEKFRPCGFRSEAWLPCFGLAEATCFVTGPTHGRVPRTAVDDDRHGLVSCGFPRQGQQIAIVDPDTRRPRAARQIGEVWVHGPSVGRGYWGRPEETAEIFGAKLPGDSRPWLATGDLGFTLDGELFITGRLKDLIIIRGSNHHPHAIENTVQRCNPAFADARGTAFSIEIDSTERLVIVQEVARAARIDFNAPAAIADIREAVSAEHGVQAHAIYLVRPASIPLTSSGKVQRRECRRRLEAEDLADFIVAQDGGSIS
jgi:acyl-CoA synthetase (AMP-forming)/AMP-acid ligase II